MLRRTPRVVGAHGVISIAGVRFEYLIRFPADFARHQSKIAPKRECRAMAARGDVGTP
jgi:hypothetical protein